MSDELKQVVFVVIVFLVIPIAAIVGAAMLLDSASCASRSKQMGMAHSWGPLQGCMIEYKPRQWIDIKKFRATDLL